MSRLIGAIVTVAVAGCVDQRQPDNKNAAEQEQAVAQEPTNAAPAGPAAGAEHSPAATEKGKGTPMLSGTFSSNSVTVPAALNRGAFRRNGNCLEVVVGGEAFTPILFAVPRDIGTNFAASSKVYDYDRRFILEGGPVRASDAGMEVSTEVRESCVAKYYAVVGIRAARAQSKSSDPPSL